LQFSKIYGSITPPEWYRNVVFWGPGPWTKRYVRKANDAKNPAILSFFFVTERTQLNAAHAQLLENLRPIAFAETCRFLTIQSSEFQEIWQKKNSSETT